ncbi:MAG: lamin tail domain-containing protein [Acidimicrobiia bacterium]
MSPAWVPAAILVVVVALPGSGESAEPGTLAGPDTTLSSSPTTTGAIATSTSTGLATTSTSIPSTTTPPAPTTVVAEPPFPQAEVLLAAPAAGPSGDPGGAVPTGAELVTVRSITDGDTLDVAFADGSVAEVRLIGINTPESNECFSDEAALTLAALAPVGSRVGVTSDVSDLDQFDRLLRYLWVGGLSVNEESVRRGAAIARRYPPDTAMADRFEVAQSEAKDAGLGLWAAEACGPRADAVVSIIALEFDAAGNDNDNLNEEWIQIRNDGDNVVDLSGWGIKDESAGNRYSFPTAFILAPGESVTIRTGCGDDFGTDLFWCSIGAAVWNNDGDTAFLLDPNGNTHTTYDYDGVTTTTQSPVTTLAPINPIVGPTDCDPSYPDVCIPPAPPDLDCGEISHRRFQVLPPDPHGFDGNDNDGLGCES